MLKQISPQSKLKIEGKFPYLHLLINLDETSRYRAIVS